MVVAASSNGSSGTCCHLGRIHKHGACTRRTRSVALRLSVRSKAHTALSRSARPAQALVDMCASKHHVAVRRLARACHASPSKPMRRAAHARERCGALHARIDLRYAAIRHPSPNQKCYTRTHRRTRAAIGGPHCNRLKFIF